MNAIILDAQATGQTGGLTMMILPMVALFAIMYVIMILPQRREQKQKAALLAQLAVGDSVRTTGGFIGTIIDVADDMVIVEFGNNRNCRIPMVKEAIVEVEKPESAVQQAETQNAPAEETGKKRLFGAKK